MKKQNKKMTGADVKSLRLRLGLTQTQFAVKLELGSYTYISAIENGRRPVSRYVELVCKELENQQRRVEGRSA